MTSAGPTLTHWAPIHCTYKLGGDFCELDPHAIVHTDREYPDHHSYVPSPQERFLSCGAFEALYGGAAGGGKTDALLGGALRHVHEPSYRALLLRREWAEVRRTLLARSEDIYPLLGGEWKLGDKTWYFPSGATIEFGHSEHEGDIKRYQGAPYQYIGVDELTHWTRLQYLFLLSRLRSANARVPVRVRSTSNPGGIGHDWVLERWAPFLYPQPGAEHYDENYEGPWAQPGSRIWFRRGANGVDEWCDPHAAGSLTRAFFPALVTDNPFYAGTIYETVLDILDPLTREQQKFGNWMARAAAGIFFPREAWKVISPDDYLADVISRVRYWDRAATTEEEDSRCDWTAGVRMARTRSGLYVVEDVSRGRWAPAEVQAEIGRCCASDPDGTACVLEQDPGQAGKFEIQHYLRELAGYDVRGAPPLGDKITRAKPWSAQVAAGNARFIRARWNEPFLREHADFPQGKKDQVDSAGGAFRQLVLLLGTGRSRLGGQQRQLARAAGGY